jgi:presenilin 1
MVILYKMRCLKVIYGWLIFSCLSLLTFFGGLTVYQLLSVNNLPLDWISFSVLVWNFSVVGILSIFWKGPLVVQQVYMVLVSVLLAVNLNSLPGWTTWALLSAVAVYDLFAVLSPSGPLKVLVETAQERNEPIPGLIYNAPSVKLGLGDFIFYSVLVCRAATLDDVTTVASTFLAVLEGLALTMLLLGIYRKALPALPISIALGIIFYFLTRVSLVPFIQKMNELQLYV